MVIMMLNMTMMMIKMVMMMSMTAIMMITMMWGGRVSREEMKSWRIWCDFDDNEYDNEYDDEYDDEYDGEYDDYDDVRSPRQQWGDEILKNFDDNEYDDDDNYGDDCLTFASLVMLSNSGSSKS